MQALGGLITVIMLAFIVTTAVDLVRDWLTQEQISKRARRGVAIVVSLFVGLFLAWNTGTGLLSLLGLEVKSKLADVLFTGFLLAGGANVMQELMDRLRGLSGGDV